MGQSLRRHDFRKYFRYNWKRKFKRFSEIVFTPATLLMLITMQTARSFA
jgi:hypothetical protein